MEIAFYLIPYVLLFVILVVCALKNTNSSSTFAYFLLFIFAALRFDVGYDYIAYYDIITLGVGYDRFEYIQYLLADVSYKLECVQIFFIINSLVTIFFIKSALKRLNVREPIVALFFLCCPLFFLNSLSVVRFWSAVSIVFYASTFLIDKKFVKFICLIFLAQGFHNSALIGFLFIPLYVVKINYLQNILILLLSVVFSKVLSTLLSQISGDYYILVEYQNYVQKDDNAAAMSKIPYLYMVMCIVLNLFLYFKSKKIKRLDQNKDNSLQLYMKIFTIGISLMFAFAFNSTLSSRISRCFLVYFLCITPIIYSKSRLLVILILFILYIYLLTISSGIDSTYEYLPYKLFIFNS